MQDSAEQDIAVQGHRKTGTTEPSSKAKSRQQHDVRVIDEESTQKPRMLQVRLSTALLEG